MLDDYSVQFYKNMDWSRGICSWNVLQTLLNKLSCAVDGSFLAMQTAGIIALLSLAASVKDMATNRLDSQPKHHFVLVQLLDMPALMMTVGTFVLLVQAAAITETCNRVPAIINSARLSNPIRAPT